MNIMDIKTLILMKSESRLYVLRVKWWTGTETQTPKPAVTLVISMLAVEKYNGWNIYCNSCCMDFTFYKTYDRRSARQSFEDMEVKSVVTSCHCVRQSSAVLFNFIWISKPSSPSSAPHLRERELVRVWPWLLIHNSHWLLHTFQNSFRLWR